MMAVEAYRSTHRVRSAGRAGRLASSGLRETLTALSESSGRAYHRSVHWLEADPREVLSLRRVGPAAGTLTDVSSDGARTARRAVPASPAVGPAGLRSTELATAEPAAEALAAGLRPFRARVQRQRAGVLLRRQLTVAALLGIALQALVLAGLIPQWALLAVLVALALALTLALRRPIPLEAVARLLDERLALFDQLATGLEIERRGTASGRPLERRALARASALLQSDSPRWRVRPSRPRREWLALAAGLALLALLVALSASGAVGAGSKSHPGTGQGVSGGQTAGDRGAKGGAHPKGRSSHQQSASQHAPGLPTAIARGNPPAQIKKALAEHHALSPPHGGGKAPATGKSSTSSPGHSLPQSGISPVTHHSQALPTRQQAPTAGHQRPGATTPSTKTAQPKGHPGAHGSSSRSSSRHPGGSGAGGAPGNNKIQTGRLPAGHVSRQLQLAGPAGYIPTHSPRTGEFGKGAEKIEGGGGRGRSAKVSGEGSTSSTGGGSFAYVAPDGGASAEGQASLLDRYFTHARSIEQELASW